MEDFRVYPQSLQYTWTSLYVSPHADTCRPEICPLAYKRDTFVKYATGQNGTKDARLVSDIGAFTRRPHHASLRIGRTEGYGGATALLHALGSVRRGRRTAATRHGLPCFAGTPRRRN